MHCADQRKKLVLCCRVLGRGMLALHLDSARCFVHSDVEMVFCSKVRQGCPHITLLCVGNIRYVDQFRGDDRFHRRKL